jgi:hypothetical protein
MTAVTEVVNPKFMLLVCPQMTVNTCMYLCMINFCGSKLKWLHGTECSLRSV